MLNNNEIDFVIGNNAYIRVEKDNLNRGKYLHYKAKISGSRLIKLVRINKEEYFEKKKVLT